MNLLVGLLIGVGAAGLAVLALRQVLLASQRQRALPIVASQAGLEYSEVDLFNTIGPPFPLFRLGDERRVTNLLWRAADRTDGQAPTVRAFDYAYRVRPDGTESAAEAWQSFSCALAQHNGAWPTIRISPENVLHRALGALGLPDIDFESEEFNRAFVIQCADRRFASAIIDAQMMTFLLESARGLTLETKGRFLLVSGPTVAATEMPKLVEMADSLLKRVPTAVRELYESFPEGAGTDVFPPVPTEGLTETGLTDTGLTDPGLTDTGWAGSALRAFGSRSIDAPQPSPFEFAPESHLAHPDANPWDPTPDVDYDLDGHPVAPPVGEDPWRDQPPATS